MSHLLLCMPPWIQRILGDPILFLTSITFHVLPGLPHIHPCRSYDWSSEMWLWWTLCARWHICFVSYPTLEDFLGLLDPNVSCTPPSFDLKSQHSSVPPTQVECPPPRDVVRVPDNTDYSPRIHSRRLLWGESHESTLLKCSGAPGEDDEEKEVGVAPAGSPCILSTFHIRLMTWRICLIGVKMWVFPSCLWVMQVS